MKVILFPRLISSDGEHRLERLSRAQAAMNLFECLVNARNLPNQGIDEVHWIAREIPAYLLHYTSFDTLSGLLEEICPQPDV